MPPKGRLLNECRAAIYTIELRLYGPVIEAAEKSGVRVGSPTRAVLARVGMMVRAFPRPRLSSTANGSRNTHGNPPGGTPGFSCIGALLRCNFCLTRQSDQQACSYRGQTCPTTSTKNR